MPNMKLTLSPWPVIALWASSGEMALFRRSSTLSFPIFMYVLEKLYFTGVPFSVFIQLSPFEKKYDMDSGS